MGNVENFVLDFKASPQVQADIESYLAKGGGAVFYTYYDWVGPSEGDQRRQGHQLSRLGEAALGYQQRGWLIHPLKSGTKDPDTKNGHLDATNDPKVIRKWWKKKPNANIGLSLAASGLVAIDPDLYKKDCEWLEFSKDKTIPETFTQRTARGGRHLVFTAKSDEKFPGTVCKGTEIKHKGYIVLAPSVFEGKEYEIESDVPPAPCPDWVPRKGSKSKKTRDHGPVSIERLRATVDRIPNDELDWEEWNPIGMAIYVASGGSNDGLDIFHDFSQKSDKYDANDVDDRWESYNSSPPTEIGFGTLVRLAREAEKVATASSPLRCIHISELAKIERPPTLVKGFLLSGATSMMYGLWKTRKSFVALDMAAHIAMGWPWCGRKVQQGAVVYIVGEGWHGMGNRVEAWCQYHKVNRDDCPLYVMEPVHLGGDGTDDADRIIATIRMLEIEPVLVVVDTLARAMNGDESSTKDMSAFIKRLDYLRKEIKSHILIIHHLGKDKDRGARGSSALPGAIDTGCLVEKIGDLTVLGPPIQRDLPEDFEQSFEARQIEIGLDEDAEPITSLVVVPTDRKPEGQEEKLPKAARAALNVLWVEIKAQRGVRGGIGGPPIEPHFYGLTEDRWQELCNAIPLTTSREENTIWKAFDRARKKLLEEV